MQPPGRIFWATDLPVGLNVVHTCADKLTGAIFDISILRHLNCQKSEKIYTHFLNKNFVIFFRVLRIGNLKNAPDKLWQHVLRISCHFFHHRRPIRWSTIVHTPKRYTLPLRGEDQHVPEERGHPRLRQNVVLSILRMNINRQIAAANRLFLTRVFPNACFRPVGPLKRFNPLATTGERVVLWTNPAWSPKVYVRIIISVILIFYFCFYPNGKRVVCENSVNRNKP